VGVFVLSGLCKYVYICMYVCIMCVYICVCVLCLCVCVCNCAQGCQTHVRDQNQRV